MTVISNIGQKANELYPERIGLTFDAIDNVIVPLTMDNKMITGLLSCQVNEAIDNVSTMTLTVQVNKRQ